VQQNHQNYVPEHREISVNYFSTFVYFLELFGEARPAGGTRTSLASIVSLL
jgi:hypothetical protein